MSEIYKEQPESPDGVWNKLEWRPLEGFVFALTPFNFTSIACNLPTSAAMMGNVVVWKPSNAQIYSAKVLMDIYKEAGLPKGIINMIFPTGPDAAEVIFNHPDFSGIHFTGSTAVFKIFGKKLGIIFKNINLTLESLGKQVEKILLWHIQVQISMLL